MRPSWPRGSFGKWASGSGGLGDAALGDSRRRRVATLDPAAAAAAAGVRWRRPRLRADAGDGASRAARARRA
eukprot:2248375-Prymnesium_polylepis.1